MTADDLVAWYRQQLDEDQRAADGGQASCWHIDACDDMGGEFHERFDPPQMLRDIEAKRRVLDEHRTVRFTDATLGIHNLPVCSCCRVVLDPGDTDDMDPPEPEQVPAAYPCRTMRFLASVYSDRPGYRVEEWAP